MSIICIPIQVDALIADDIQPVVGASQQFDKLPYQNFNKLDINSQQPFIASAVSRRAFNNMGNLPKGVHFHWSLPDALTKGKSTDDGLEMPTVPNRWLIQRIKKNGTVIEKQWVVESDYLFPSNVTPERAVQIPATDDRKPGEPAYRYLGRQLTLEQWQKEQADHRRHDYLKELNVLGWGSAYFSALYTECYSVFGAYDDEIPLNEVANYKYRVYGWHNKYEGKGEDDFVKKYLTPKNSGDLEMQKRLACDVADWNLTGGSETAEKALYFGSVLFNDGLVIDDNIVSNESQLSFAKTSTEAVATFLSKNIEQSEESSIRVENQLQAALFSEAMAGENIDFVNRLKMARHKEGFTPEPSMSSWRYTPFTSLLSQEFDKGKKETFKQAYQQFCQNHQKILDRLNSSLDQLDKATMQLSSLRKLLYADWSKYMQCRYPVDHAAAMPDADLVRHMIEQQTLPLLEALPKHIEDMEQQSSIDKKQITEAFTIFCEHQGISESTDIDGMGVLLEVPGSRYWCAKEPSLMIEGDVAKPSTRHGVDGPLKCHYHTGDSASMIDWLLDSANTDALEWTGRAQTEWLSQPWNPLCMEWRLDLHAESEDEFSSTSNQINYQSDYITSRYRVPLNDDEFSLPGASVDYCTKKQQGIVIDDNPNVVYGRSLLTFKVKDQVKAKLQKALDHSSSVDPNGLNTLIKTLKHAIEYIDDDQHHILTQQLTGYHESLLMYNDEISLCVDDPLAFSSANPEDPQDKTFTDRVREALGNGFYNLPSLGHQFTPIKCGVTKLSRVRVIDSFGRFKDLDCSQVIQPQRNVLGNNMYTPPRVLQPLRLAFRWKNTLESVTQQQTPICGWINYNLFDQTIVCYSYAGKLLGSINSDGEWTNEFGLLQTLSVVEDENLKTFILKLLSFHYANRLVKPTSREDLTLWQQLYDHALLSPLYDANDAVSQDKGQLIPISEDNWPENQIGMTLSDARVRLSRMSAKNNGKKNYFPSLKKAIQRAQENIEPAIDNKQTGNFSIKPLAVVNATLDLQLYGFPEINKSWAALSQDLVTNKRSSRHYGDVKFPIKLGEYNNLDDGLVAYWLVKRNGSLTAHGSFPQSDMADIDGWIDGASFKPQESDYIDAVDDEGVNNIEQSFNDEPFELLMLMDPKCVVHATTGIAPKKTLHLDPILYVDSLEAIQQRYFAAPLLTPKETLSLPLTRNNAWLFQQVTGTGECEQTSSIPIADKTAFTGISTVDVSDWQLLISEGLLLPIKGSQGLRAYYIAPAQEKSDKLENAWPRLELALLQCCSGGIVAPENIVPLSQRVCAVEGWIESMPEPNNQ